MHHFSKNLDPHDQGMLLTSGGIPFGSNIGTLTAAWLSSMGPWTGKAWYGATGPLVSSCSFKDDDIRCRRRDGELPGGLLPSSSPL